MLLALAVFSSLLLNVGATPPYHQCGTPEAEIRSYKWFFGQFKNQLQYDVHIGEAAHKELWDHIIDRSSTPQAKFEDKMRSALQNFKPKSAQISALPKGAPYGCSCRWSVFDNTMDILCFFRKFV
ncbi:hypothetical protein OSTOST_04779 [Ostertagia ostertagi]